MSKVTRKAKAIVRRLKHRIDRTAYRIDQKMHPERILSGSSVRVISNGEAFWIGNIVQLRNGEEVVKQYDEVQSQSIRIIGNVRINNRGDWNLYAFSADDELWDQECPIYTLTHDQTIYISDDPQTIKEAIFLECGHECIIK